MPKLVLYIAASLDGYIARHNGAIDWLVKFNNAITDFGYKEFYATVDAILMGKSTYDVTASFGEWPHADRPCYVLSNTAERVPYAEVVRGDLGRLVKNLKSKHEHVWLVGGAKIVHQAIAEKCLDEIIVTIIPVLLGAGIRLFEGPTPEVSLSQTEARSYAGGLTQMKYTLGYAP